MAVSDVNMSSEGSSTSRVRQFGLYKTVDSHTAEFLKLSRKRQIRRGCACAAVSTAITVTVVVSALLVFEYGFRTDFKMVPNTLRQLNWFQTVNESKATFDRNTPINSKNNGKLLGIILKALDQKRYLETIVEEHSSQRSAHESTDYPFQKNVFADKNRRIPLKMYEVYKATSQELFNARRRESLAKARKVTDYQRLMTYLNTMTLSKKTAETIYTDVSTTSKPYITGIHRNAKIESQDFKYQTTKTNRRKEIHNKHVYCTCPPRSNLTEILEKLYISIQELQPKAIVRIPNNTKNRDRSKPNNKNTVKVQQSKYYSDQTAYISKKNNQHTTGKIPSKANTSIFTKYSIATMKSYDKVKAKNSRGQNEMTTNRNEYKRHKNNNTYTGETMPWKLDFGITSYDDTSSIYVNTDINTANNSTLGKMTESDAIAKYSQADEQYDFDEKIYNTPPEPNQYVNNKPVYNIKTHETKRKTTEEYNSIASYINGISKKFANTSIFNNTQFSLEYPTVKPLDTNVYSYEIVDPIKIVPTVTDKPVEGKQQQNLTQLDKNSNDTVSYTAVECKNNSSCSLTKQQDGKLSAKPIAAKKVDEKLPLDPMIQSYLLSKKDSGILNVGAEKTLQGIELQTTNSEELPFNIKFTPNEEDEHVSILNDLYAAKITTNTTEPFDTNKEGSQTKKNSPERSEVSKAGKKEKILSLTQIREPMYESKKHLKSSTEAPRNYVYKKPKIKEIFYMTGGETPVEDFDDNLSSLIYYDKSPVNYTALANSYLRKIENDSIETLSKSMLPESRPSPLEIRRTHERVDFYTTHLYSSVEQK